MIRKVNFLDNLANISGTIYPKNILKSWIKARVTD